MSRLVVAGALAGVAAVLVAGCGKSGEAADAIVVDTSDTTCKVAKTALTAGTHTFTIKSSASKVTEFEILRADGRIVAEQENIGPSTTVTLDAELTAGTYHAACIPGMVGKGIRTPLKVTGGKAAKGDPQLDAAVSAYRDYVDAQVDDTLTKTRTFVAAVRAGDVAKAKRLYAPSRYGWESIEPVAESFGDIDPKVDLRERDLQAGQKWTGWHVLEKALWTSGSTRGTSRYADRLVRDLTELKEKVGTAVITPTSMANGAKELLDEVATNKVTGEEEAFSHTDLSDFEANVVGAKKVYTLLRPVVVKRDRALASSLDTEFTAVLGALRKYEHGDAYVSYATVGEDGRKQLSDRVNALAEPLSKLAGVVAR
ncbi:MAG: cupredoxin domain-containing protein [Acidothermales bacterium]|nr:cupredoxin domain-containing protein [Acidothermales bacterium]